MTASNLHTSQGDGAPRVLLVEDHKPLSKALKCGLEEENFAVDVADDGEEADFKAGTPRTTPSFSI